MLIVDLSLARVVQHSPFQFHAHAYTVEVIQCLSCRVHPHGACMHMITITLCVQILTTVRFSFLGFEEQSAAVVNDEI